MRSSRLSIVGWVAGCAALVSCDYGKFAAGGDAELDIEIDDHRLVSIDARDVPLEDVLRELARQAGLSIRSAEALDEHVTIAFDDLPIASAIGRILGRRRFTLMYYGIWSGPPEGSPNRLTIFADDEPADTFAPDADGSAAPPPVDAPEPLARIDAALDLAADDAAHVAALTTIALSDPDEKVREEAIRAIGETRGLASLLVLEQALRDPSPRVREAVVVALADQRDARAVRMLASVLDDPAVAVREEARYALSSPKAVDRSPTGTSGTGRPAVAR